MAETLTLENFADVPVEVQDAYKESRQLVVDALAVRGSTTSDAILTAVRSFRSVVGGIIEKIRTQSATVYPDATALTDFDAAAQALIAAVKPYLGLSGANGLRGIDAQISDEIKRAGAAIRQAIGNRTGVDNATVPQEVLNQPTTSRLKIEPGQTMDTASIIIGILSIAAVVAIVAYTAEGARKVL